MPVLPDVASISVSPGRISPRASAPSIIAIAGRSFTEPAGLLPSSLPSSTLPRASSTSRPMRCRRASGVRPIASSTVGYLRRLGVLLGLVASVRDRTLVRQLDGAAQLAIEDRLAQALDRRHAREALAPGERDAAHRRRRREGDVAQQVVIVARCVACGDRQYADADPRGDHVADRLQRRGLEGLVDADARLRKARQLRADLEHVVAEAMAAAEQEHRLLLELDRTDRLPLRPGMRARHRD